VDVDVDVDADGVEAGETFGLGQGLAAKQGVRVFEVVEAYGWGKSGGEFVGI
jgi:hypothetical protein